MKKTYDINHEQLIYPVTIIRGGTSRALFFHANGIPKRGNGQEEFLKAAVGEPDSYEIDGLGGGEFWNSKIAIVAPSKRQDADVDYTFVQIEPRTDLVIYNANCGNISAGVPIFALDKKMITLPDGINIIRIWNTNTNKLLLAELEVKNNTALVHGDYQIAGIPGTGAKIFMDYRHTLGAITNKIFPTGNAIDTIEMENGTKINITICDVANLIVFVKATALNLKGTELPTELNKNQQMFQICKEIRGKAAKLAGLVDCWQDGQSLFLPPVCLVTHPTDYVTNDGHNIKANQVTLLGRIVTPDSVHPTFMGTGSCCFAAAAAILGTIPNQLLKNNIMPQIFKLGHPGGIMPVEVDLEPNSDFNQSKFNRLGFGRTARKICEGRLFIKCH